MWVTGVSITNERVLFQDTQSLTSDESFPTRVRNDESINLSTAITALADVPDDIDIIDAFF